jgi:hypothetical protein
MTKLNQFEQMTIDIKKNVGIDNGINNHTNHLFIKLQPSKHKIGTGND